METDRWLDKVITTYSSGKADRAFSEELWPAVCDAAARLQSRLQITAPARILDLACGSGSMTIALALRGHRMTGIDCTPASIETARQQSQRLGATVKWRCMDMRQLDEHEAFEVVCLRDVIFGVLPAPEQDQQMLASMAAALMPGGKCLLEVYDRSFALKHGVERVLRYDSSRDLFINPDRPEGLTLRLYSRENWQAMLRQVGLRITSWDGWSWKDDPPAPPHRADLIVAEKTLHELNQRPSTA